MPLAIAWWGWAIVVVVALVALFRLIAGYGRRILRRGFMAHLKRHAPEFEVVKERAYSLVLRNRNSGTEGPLVLDRLYDAVLRLNPSTIETRGEVYDRWITMLRDGEAARGALFLESHRDRIFPRLITGDFFDQVHNGLEAPHKPLGDTGLFVAYVLDSENSVMYLTKPHLEYLK